MISAELDKDIHFYQTCLEYILTYSPNAKVFCLIHKVDLIQEEERDKVNYIFIYIIFSSYLALTGLYMYMWEEQGDRFGSFDVIMSNI